MESIAFGISALRMNQRQTIPLRKFSALKSIMPTLMPMTSVSIQPLFGLNASVNPYLP